MIQLEWTELDFCNECYTTNYPTIIKDCFKTKIGYYKAYEEDDKWYLFDDKDGNLSGKVFDSLGELKTFAQRHYELKIVYNINRLEFVWPKPEEVDINYFDEDLVVDCFAYFDIAESNDIYIEKSDKDNYLIKYVGEEKIIKCASSYEEATKLAEELHKEFLMTYFEISEKEYKGDNLDFDFSDAGSLISRIRSGWEDEHSGMSVLKDGTNLSYHCPKAGIRNVKITNSYTGLSFTIKRQAPNLNIDHLLNTSFRFAYNGCALGEKVQNKGIVTAISKKQERPTIKTLKENTFTIDNEVYQTLDLNNLNDIEKLFSYYKYNG